MGGECGRGENGGNGKGNGIALGAGNFGRHGIPSIFLVLLKAAAKRRRQAAWALRHCVRAAPRQNRLMNSRQAINSGVCNIFETT
jgi:hypothetical protein